MKKLLLILLCLPMIGFGQTPVSGVLKAITGVFNQGVQYPISDLAASVEEYYNSDVANVSTKPFRNLNNISVIAENFKEYTLTLRTISGIVVWQTENINAETTLPKDSLKSGMYILELKNEKQKQLERINIE